jgi:hypothetical protein
MRMARESRWLATICALDLITTLWFVYGLGAEEANPLMRRFLDHGALTFIIAKSALVLGPLYVLEWARRRRPRFVHGALRVGIVLYIASYCGVVWRVNAGADDGQAADISPAEIAALEKRCEQPTTREEVVRQRAALALLQWPTP